jgi:uncharacterized protein (DUF488 family)
MLTPEFAAAVAELLLMAQLHRTTIMCAEKLYTRCHRQLLCDFLVVHGVAVHHIVDHGTMLPHQLSVAAVIRDDGCLVYPAEQQELF